MSFMMPAEWEKHAATWIAWPHEKTDWLDKFPAICWVYCEIVRHISRREKVHIICHNESVAAEARHALKLCGLGDGNFALHLQTNNRSWLRDSAPTAVFKDDRSLAWIAWQFNAWAKYDNYELDAKVPELVAQVSAAPVIVPKRPDSEKPLVLEGGAIESDGEGTLLVTEECLLSNVQERNPGLTRSGYEQAFKEYLGTSKTIWLGKGCEGDDTHGHIDDVARFVAPGKVLLAFEEDPTDPFHRASIDNLDRLHKARDARGRELEVMKLPMPQPTFFDEQRMPSSYANFYIANGSVLVPTFNDPRDFEALEIIRKAMPHHEVVGINSSDLIVGQGTLHCLTQQQPAP